MNLVVTPATSLHGELRLPGDKSLSHRAALFAALAAGQSRIDNFLDAGVTRAMLQALSGLGVSWQLETGTLLVEGAGLRNWHPPQGPLDCGHSGTTMRMLAGALAAAGLPAVIDGSAGLRRRPMERVVAPLRAMGVPIESAPGGGAPLVLHRRPESQRLRGLEHELSVASAQVKTALLLAGLAADGPTTVIEPGVSRDHTERLLASMGARLSQGNGHRAVLEPPVSPLSPLDIQLPGDFSTAAFLIVAALVVPGSHLRLVGVGLNPTRTGLLDALGAMGGHIAIHNLRERHGEPLGDLVVRHTHLQGARIDGSLAERMIDEFPAFAVAAAVASGATRVSGAAELRHKESDRIAALSQGLQALGVALRARPDGFEISGGARLQGGRVPSFGDHRMAMALAVAGLAAEAPVLVEGAELIGESFPGFAGALQTLGAQVAMEEEE